MTSEHLKSCQGGEWRPIDSAPKDKEIIGWFPWHCSPDLSTSCVWVMRWNEDKYAKKPRPYFEASGWVWGVRDQREKQPTHWMPLPNPPA